MRFSFSAFTPFIYPPGMTSLVTARQCELTLKCFPKIHRGADFGALTRARQNAGETPWHKRRVTSDEPRAGGGTNWGWCPNVFRKPPWGAVLGYRSRAPAGSQALYAAVPGGCFRLLAPVRRTQALGRLRPPMTPVVLTRTPLSGDDTWAPLTASLDISSSGRAR
jgi:hypothetical protein